MGIITLEPPSIGRLGLFKIGTSRRRGHPANRVWRPTAELSPEFLILLPQVRILRLNSFEILHTRYRPSSFADALIEFMSEGLALSFEFDYFMFELND